MSLDILEEKGVPLHKQKFTWRELVQEPISKLDNDAFTRVRIILMNGIGEELHRFLHMLARMNGELRKDLADVRRPLQHMQTQVNWLLPADQSPLETTIGYEQVAIEVTASVAQAEPDPYLAQVYRFGLLEDFDHLYRYSGLMDRLEGKDANNIVQSYSDIMPGRPTAVEHRAPEDDLRNPYERATADPLTKLNALTILSGEQQTRNYYMNVGPFFTDPVARQLYAEIASIEEQHVTQYESLLDPDESVLESWLMHHLNAVYNYWSCMEFEDDARIRAIWERHCSYSLGHLHHVMDLFRRVDGRDPAELLPKTLPEPIQYRSQREFVRNVLDKEVHYRARGAEIGEVEESEATLAYRKQMNSDGSPSETVAEGYVWAPGGELMRKAG